MALSKKEIDEIKALPYHPMVEIPLEILGKLREAGRYFVSFEKGEFGFGEIWQKDESNRNTDRAWFS